MELKKLKVFYVHGLEGHPQGTKATFLRKKCESVYGIDMGISLFRVNKPINAPYYFIKTLFSKPFIANKMLMDCVNKQKEELKKYKDDHFDLFLGSSWGGAVLIELMREEGIIKHDRLIVLMAPAHRLVNPTEFTVSENMKKFRFIQMMHGGKDTTVPVEHSKELHKELEHSNLVIVKDSIHPLNITLHDKKGGLVDILNSLIKRRNDSFKKENQESEEEEDEDEGEASD